MINILTFDLEEWYNYRILLGDNSSDNRLEYYLDIILNLFVERSINATFFVLGAVARSHPHILKKIFEAGHEIGCHSNVHSWLTELNQSQFEEDTKVAISSIEEVTGVKVYGYRAPAFSITSKNIWTLEALKKYGIEYDCSIFPAARDFGGFAEFSTNVPTVIKYNGIIIKEFPMGIANILGRNIAYSGGGYLRLLPYFTIKKNFSLRNYNMTYFHLRDFDKEQKKTINLRYFKNYYGINSAMAKFQKLITDFDFINIAQANTNINWASVPIVRL